MRKRAAICLPVTCVVMIGALAACGASDGPGWDGGDVVADTDGGNDAEACSPEGAGRCNGNAFEECAGGAWQPVEDCSASTLVCVAELGCVTCVPGRPYCEGERAMTCDEDGMGLTLAEDCTLEEGQVCDPVTGTCAGLCELAERERSNVGCEFWAVDLDNWYGTDVFNPDASGEQFALVVTNPGDTWLTVTVEQNDAGPGEPLDLATVWQEPVGPLALTQIDLPQREVDGSVLNQNEGTGTALTSHAYRVTSTAPVVVYQFNPVYQMHTNDASILIPTHALDTGYLVLGYQGIGSAVNPLNPSSTNYSFLAIVGIEPGTEVDVALSADIASGGPVVTWTGAGSTVHASLGQFDVLNLEGHCPPGMTALACMSSGVTDFTGTRVTSTAPVAVFAGVECTNVVPPTCGSDSCCCDHLEDQVFPTISLGKKFVAPHSPYRGGSEDDLWRVIADRDGTSVTTNLPGAYSSFALDAGEFMEIWTSDSFVIEASDPVLVGQYLASQGCTGSATGDPSFTIFPPVEQYRSDYTFLVPATFDGDNAMIVVAEGTSATIDGVDVGAGPSGCDSFAGGSIDGVTWDVLHCPLVDGVHRLEADAPVGLGVYGYGPAGSYAYPGGTSLERINIPE